VLGDVAEAFEDSDPSLPTHETTRGALLETIKAARAVLADIEPKRGPS
jgi:hypothetical protein